MIIFNSIEIEGFGSILDLRYYLGKKGINLIQGPNGVGKTTIFNALSWALFRYLIKEGSTVIPWDVVQKDPSYKGTKVMVHFGNYSVIRCQDYNGEVFGAKGKDRLLLIQDGKERTDLRDKNETQAEIERILGYSFKLFKNSILFGQKLTRIIKETGPNKKAMFDEAFEVAFINDTKKKAEKDRLEASKEHIKFETQYKDLKKDLQVLKDQKTREEEVIVKFEETKKKNISSMELDLRVYDDGLSRIHNDGAQIDQVEKEIEAFRNELKVIELKLHDHNRLSDESFKLELDISQNEGELKDLQDSIDKLTKKWGNIPKNCPRCSQRLDPKGIKEEKQKLQKEIVELKGKLAKISDLTLGLNKKLKNVEKEQIKLTKFTSEKKQLEYQIKKQTEVANEVRAEAKNFQFYMDEIKNLNECIEKEKNKQPEDRVNPIIIKIRKARKEYGKVKKEYLTSKKKLNLLNWVIDDPLSNKGIKAYVFNTMLGLVNRNLEKYSDQLGYRVNFRIDLDSARKDFETSIFQGEGGKEKFYGELSGGQQQMVDVAIAFAIHDTVTLNKGVNILIMDEVFESLSEENIEKVIDLIKIKGKDLAIHLITHLTSFNMRTSKVLKLKLISGITSPV